MAGLRGLEAEASLDGCGIVPAAGVSSIWEGRVSILTPSTFLRSSFQFSRKFDAVELPVA